MKFSQMALSAQIALVFLMFVSTESYSQKPALEFGKAVSIKDITPATQGKEIPLKWKSYEKASNTNKDPS